MGLVGNLNLLLQSVKLPEGIQWAEAGNGSRVFHRIPSVEFHSWLIRTPEPGDELLVVSAPLVVHVAEAANARAGSKMCATNS